MTTTIKTTTMTTTTTRATTNTIIHLTITPKKMASICHGWSEFCAGVVGKAAAEQEEEQEQEQEEQQ